jgi:hypothetical protein
MSIFDVTTLDQSTYAKTALVIGAVLILASIITNWRDGLVPAPWLTEWTNWAFTYVGLVVAAGGVVGLTNSIVKRLQYFVDDKGIVRKIPS